MALAGTTLSSPVLCDSHNEELLFSYHHSTCGMFNAAVTFPPKQVSILHD
jgi:hypothetical protein